MDLKKLSIREVPFNQWHNLRLANGVRSQKPYFSSTERLAYGIIIDPLVYSNFTELFEDLNCSDYWLGGFGFENGERKSYSGAQLREMFTKKDSKNKKLLEAHLEKADKVSLSLINPDTLILSDHIYFRKNDSGVYSATMRVCPSQLKRFSKWGFNDPAIVYAKADCYMN